MTLIRPFTNTGSPVRTAEGCFCGLRAGLAGGHPASIGEAALLVWDGWQRRRWAAHGGGGGTAILELFLDPEKKYHVMPVQLDLCQIILGNSNRGNVAAPKVPQMALNAGCCGDIK